MFDIDGDSGIDLAEMTALLGLYDLDNAEAYLQAFDIVWRGWRDIHRYSIFSLQDKNGELDLQEYKAGFYPNMEWTWLIGKLDFTLINT